MDAFWLFLILAALQGVTEVFPISSTGHLAVFRQIMTFPLLNLPLTTGLHGGSLIAIMLYFHRDLSAIWYNFRCSLDDLHDWAKGGKSPLSRPREHFVPYLLALSLAPVAAEGLLLRPIAERAFQEHYLVLFFLILNGVMILAAAFLTDGERTMKELSWWHYLVIGLVQGFAVLPGISRLGVVLCACLWCRLKWQVAIKLTFILAIPVLMGGMLVEAGDVLRAVSGDFQLALLLAAGVVIAAIGSWFGLKLITSRLLERHTLALFGYYCMMFGSFFLVYLFFWYGGK